MTLRAPSSPSHLLLRRTASSLTNCSCLTSINIRLSMNSFIGIIVFPPVSLNYVTKIIYDRKLKPDARPTQDADDPTGICSAADSRLTVYPTIDLAKKFWIKGKLFSVPALLNVSPDSEQAKMFDEGSLALFRSVVFSYCTSVFPSGTCDH